MLFVYVLVVVVNSVALDSLSGVLTQFTCCLFLVRIIVVT